MTVDILMPFYGRFDHFKAAVSSVIAQTNPNWRLVVIDDQYPDLAPGRWVRDLGDSRIEYLRNSTNLGVSGNFRRAAELAVAEYAVIMGCDDVMLPEYVETVSSLAMQFPDVAIIQPGVEVIDEAGARVLPLGDRVKRLYRIGGRKPAVYGGEILARSLLRGNWTYFPSLCWKVEYLRRYEFRPDLDVVLDLALQLEILVNGGTMLVDDTVCFLYRRHSASVSSWTASDGTRFAQEAKLFAESEQRLRAMGWRRAARAAHWHLTSRLNAVTKLPRAIRQGSRADTSLLASHVVGRKGR
jgi:glycosyltransferase involved in cell wall biosynthesis